MTLRHRKITLRGKRWELAFVPFISEGSFGECDDPCRVGKQIRIAENQSESEMLDTVLHEALHACLPDLAEHAVAETSESLSSLLKSLGIKGIKKG